MARSKKIMTAAVFASMALYLLIFLMYFVPNYVMEVNEGSIEFRIYNAIGSYVTKFLEFAIPAIACAVVYFSDSSQKTTKAYCTKAPFRRIRRI